MRILFLRFGSIGNALISAPAIRAAAKALPDAFLALLCNPATHELWQGCPWLDRVMVYDQKGRDKAPVGYLRMIAELRRLKFTHSVHFRRFIRSELIGFLAGAKTRIGFDPGGLSLLNRKVPYSEEKHMVEQNLGLVRELGIRAEDTRLEYWTPEPSPRVKNLIARAKTPLVVLHPFAHTQRGNRWQKFPELARKLRDQFGADIILIGAGNEKELFDREWSDSSPVQTAFDLPLPELAALLKSAGLYIGSDSGPLHLACAVGTPAISIYTWRPDLQNHLKKWMPLATNFKAVFAESADDKIEITHVLNMSHNFLQALQDR